MSEIMPVQTIKLDVQELTRFHDDIDNIHSLKQKIEIQFGGKVDEDEKEHLAIGIHSNEEDAESIYICLDKIQSRLLANILLEYANH
jgi:hypothetical protein